MADGSVKVTVKLTNYNSSKSYKVGIDGYGEEQGTSGSFSVPAGTHQWARGTDGGYVSHGYGFTAAYDGQEVVVDMAGG